MADRILICDDEKNIRLTVAAALENEGYEIETAVNGEDALRKIAENNSAVILLDLWMPGMDGLEVMRRLADSPLPPKIVVLTARGTIDVVVEAMKLGAVDFIQKPFSPDEIRKTVAQAITIKAAAESDNLDYDSRVAQVIELIKSGRRSEALEASRRALYDNPRRPEAYNLLGVLNELQGDIPEAQKFYRSALDIDPAYTPSETNLERTASFTSRGSIHLGERPLQPEEPTGRKNSTSEENS